MASNENKADDLQAVFDGLTLKELAECETLRDVEKLVNETYENSLM